MVSIVADFPEPWPAVQYESQTWEWDGHRASSRADRLFRDFASAVPANIADIELRLGARTLATLEEATLAIADLDRERMPAGVSGALLRSESVASSKIEHLDIDAQALATAAAGEAKARSAAAQVWANVRAMEAAVAAGDAAAFTIETILGIHHILMADDPYEKEWAGRLRTMQNWIGGSDECPRDALFVPPAPRHVVSAMEDLVAFIYREDLPALAQAAIAHAQFETIHPVTDGNGRVGRTLIHTVLRRRRLATHVVTPTSSALLADVDGYFDSLDAYRTGNIDDYLVHFAAATTSAAHEALRLSDELRQLSDDWTKRVKPRAGSVGAAILANLVHQPVISSTLHGGGQADPAAVHRAIARLVEADVLLETTGAKRNRVWVAKEVTAALDDFGRRIGRRRRSN